MFTYTLAVLKDIFVLLDGTLSLLLFLKMGGFQLVVFVQEDCVFRRLGRGIHNLIITDWNPLTISIPEIASTHHIQK